MAYTHQKILCISVAYPDPDQSVYLNADSDPDPVSQTNEDPCESGFGSDFAVTNKLDFDKKSVLHVGNTS
jgi:hypothetical protein